MNRKTPYDSTYKKLAVSTSGLMLSPTKKHKKIPILLYNNKIIRVGDNTNQKEKVFEQKLDYTHQNPVCKGLCNLPEDYFYSSAKYYLLDEREQADYSLYGTYIRMIGDNTNHKKNK